MAVESESVPQHNETEDQHTIRSNARPTLNAAAVGFARQERENNLTKKHRTRSLMAQRTDFAASQRTNDKHDDLPPPTPTLLSSTPPHDANDDDHEDLKTVNPPHCIIFIIIGAILGAAIALLSVRHSKNAQKMILKK